MPRIPDLYHYLWGVALASTGWGYAALIIIINSISLFLDLPNHLKEIRECNNVKKHTSYNLPEGRFDSTEISCKKGNKWVEKWYGIVRKGNKVSKFKDIWEEFIFQPKMLVISLKKIGFKILKIYGSMMGDRFDKNKSWRIVYLCRK